MRRTMSVLQPENAATIAESGNRLHDEGDALAATDAGAGEAVTHAAAPHLLQQGQCEASAARRERMTQGDGAAVDLELLDVEAQLADHAEDLSGERLVDFPEADVLLGKTGLRDRFACGGRGAEAHELRLDADDTPRDDASERLPAAGGLGRGDDDCRAAVDDPGRVSGCHRAV